MPHDRELADRLREALVPWSPTEKAMFGGVGFMVGGHMAIAASNTGGLLVRCHPDDTEALVSREGAEPFEMRGRPMAGWLRVHAEVVESDEALLDWVEVGTTYAGSLDPRSG